jgi:hypothetical protein
MNVVGKIGQHMIDHQEIIEYILLGILALIIVVWIIRLVVNAVRRKNVLEEIDSKVEDIHNTVNRISENQIASLGDDEPEEACKKDEDVSGLQADLQEENVDGSSDIKRHVSAADESFWRQGIETDNPVTSFAGEGEKESPCSCVEGENPLKPGIEDGDHEVSSQKAISEFTYGWGNDLVKAEKRSFERHINFENRDDPDGQMNFNKYTRLDTYNSRDCGKDKHGNIYTEEALKKQIR